jgi:uncharacterized protein YjbJ (UPF0337 family)
MKNFGFGEIVVRQLLDSLPYHLSALTSAVEWSAGKAVGNPNLEVKGTLQKGKGEAQQAVGKARDAVKKVIDKA